MKEAAILDAVISQKPLKNYITMLECAILGIEHASDDCVNWCVFCRQEWEFGESEKHKNGCIYAELAGFTK